MAKLSERTEGGKECPPKPLYQEIRWDTRGVQGVPEQDIQDLRNFNNKQENKMATLNTNNTVREVTITLLDTNPNLEDDKRIVFQKKGIVTTSTNDEVKMELLMSGDVKPALEKHNEVRTSTIDGEFLDKHGRDVSLKPIKHITDPQLQWRVVETA